MVTEEHDSMEQNWIGKNLPKLVEEIEKSYESQILYSVSKGLPSVISHPSFCSGKR